MHDRAGHRQPEQIAARLDGLARGRPATNADLHARLRVQRARQRVLEIATLATACRAEQNQRGDPVTGVLELDPTVTA